MSEVIFELCAESVAACLAGRDGGAHRIELCSALREHGVTPSHALIREAVERSGLPVHVLLRPNNGDFVYNDEELALMREDLLHARALGAAGVVLGILLPEGRVDMERTRAMVELAAPLPVTFHRAIDCTPDIEQALEDVIATGCARVLTSGGADTVLAGAATLARLQAQAAGRIVIAAGGGLKAEGAAALAQATGVRHFHGSVQSNADEDGPAQGCRGPLALPPQKVVRPEDVRKLVAALESVG